MKINKKKLGFTLVELLVVIAILAVLATVAIIGYSSFINEAHKSNDNSVVTELNHYLKAANPLDEKVPTATDAAEKLEGCGLNIAQLQPSTKDAYYGYNYETKEFVFVEGPLQVSGANIKTFLFAKNQTQVDAIYAAHYSVYLQEGYESTDFNAVYGLDVGKATVGAVTYTNTTSDQKTDGIEVVIRTNGGTLTVNAPSDDIHHYGYAEKVDIKDVKATSYHENGNVELIKVQKGHVELESAAQVLGVYVYTEDASAGFEDIKITVNQGAEIPQLSRSAVVIDDEGTKVCTVVTDQAKDIYLFNEGIYEQIKVADEGADKSTAEWVDKVEAGASENTQNAAWQLANEYNGTRTNGSIDDKSVEITDGENAGTYTVKFNEDSRTFETYTTGENPTLVEEVYVINETTAVAVDQSGKDENQAVSELGLFGKGTKDDPFLIYDYATMQKISNYYNEGSFYFEVALDKTNNGTIDCTNWKSVNLRGSFDGKNVKFINLDNKLFNYTYKATVSNFTVENPYIVKNGFTAVVSNYAYYVTYENITINGGYVQGSNSAASFVGLGFGTYPNSFEFKNCTSSATLASQAVSVGGFIAHPYSNISSDKNAFSDGVNPIRIVIDNSSFTGVMQAASGSHYAYVYGNGDNACLVEIKNSDTSLFTGYTGAFNSYTTYQEIHYADSTKKSSMPNVTATKNENDTFSVNAVSSASYAKAILIISPNDTTDRYGSYSGTYMEEDLSLNDGKFTTSTIKAFSITINDSNVSSTTGLFDGTFNVVNSYYGHTHNGAVVRIIQYNELGNIVAISNYTIAESTTLH